MSNYSIKDLEHFSGIKAHTIRIWEQRYDILRPDRTDTNIRYYNQTELKLLLNIALLKNNGYKISTISKMKSNEISKQVLKVSINSKDYSGQIQSLTIAMMDFNEELFNQTYTNCLSSFGFENTMINIIFPFMKQIGNLWTADSIYPAQEHFISSLIRQKTIVAIDKCNNKTKENCQKYLFFLPENESHELGLLFGNYIVTSRHHKVIYLGQNIPFEDLKIVQNQQQPDYIFSIFTLHPSPENLQAYINLIASTFPNTKILLTGSQLVGKDYHCPSNVKILQNIYEFIEIASH
ncbi:MAG: MerR family transcriptional regulator [Pseudarcicella sp.]|nr:MerR family transcriptional regulator [Pseudarcicella sp.]MBP6410417.1 MerR family transcriptional regulator [Pseudarcicella sp.]